MSNVAYNTSALAESTKSGHVTYDIYSWQVVAYGGCSAYDPDTGTCTSWYPDSYGWVYTGSGSTGAKVNGTVTSSGQVIVEGKAIAKVGSTTSETWVADPPIPSSNSSTQYRATSPTSGSGSGSVTVGNSNRVFANGQSVAVVGSSVRTSIGNNTTINSGSSKVKIGG